MKVTALAGGVGGAKLLVGLQDLVGRDLTAIVNTADDTMMYGVYVSPDVDIVTYWLAGIAHRARGWGIAGDTFAVLEGLENLGTETWFRLGDRDFATCAYRTERLSQGATRSAIADEIARSLGATARVLPMSDEPVRTLVTCADGRTLAFQEYFVRERHGTDVREVRFAGIDDAKPAPGVVDEIMNADIVVLCPSNPIVSIGPIVELDGVREALRRHRRVVGVSPIVRGAPIKGPADKLLAAAGAEVSAAGVAALYRDFCDVFVVDSTDRSEADRVAALGMTAVALDTMMVDRRASTALARELLELA